MTERVVNQETGEIRVTATDEIHGALFHLSELYTERDLNSLKEREEIDEILTPEIKARVAAIKGAWKATNELLEEQIAEVESTAKATTLEHGETIKTPWITAIWNKGRESWDNKALDGYAIGHPEIEVFRKVGDSYVSLRRK